MEGIGARGEGNLFLLKCKSTESQAMRNFGSEEEVCGIGMKVWAVESERLGFKSSSTTYLWYDLELLSEIHWLSVSPFVKTG